MPYVLTVDQRASRRGPDRVGDVLEQADDGEGLRVKVALSPDERARLDQRLGQGA